RLGVATLLQDHVPAAATDLVHGHPARHAGCDEGVRDGASAQRWRPRHREHAHRPVHLPDRLPASTDRLRQCGVDGADGHHDRDRADSDALRPQGGPLMRIRGVNIWLTALLVLLAALFAFPMLWVVLSSFKPGSELFSLPLSLFPKNWTVSGYETAWNRFDFWRYFANTGTVAVLATVFTVLVSAMTGYAFAKYKHWWLQAFFICILIT